MTVRASPPISRAQPKDPKDKIPDDDVESKSAFKVDKPAVTTTAPIPRIQTKAERADEEAAKSAPPIESGTHRFTLLDKDALQLISVKKPSSCEFAKCVVKSMRDWCIRM